MGSELQANWRCCIGCFALVYGGPGCSGPCVAGEPHLLADNHPPYYVRFGDPRPGEQDSWRWCNICQGLVYSWFGNGVYGGGPHDFTGSSPYNVLMTDR